MEIDEKKLTEVILDNMGCGCGHCQVLMCEALKERWPIIDWKYYFLSYDKDIFK